MKKTILRFGTYSSISICILFLISWFVLKDLPFSIQEVLGYVSMILALGFVYFGIRHYRDQENNGKIPFKTGLKIGVLISLITAMVFGVLDVLYTEVFNPDFMTEYYNRTVDDMKNSLPPEQFQVKLAELESQKELFSNPIFTFAIMGFTVFVIGFIISLLSALVLQRK